MKIYIVPATLALLYVSLVAATPALGENKPTYTSFGATESQYMTSEERIIDSLAQAQSALQNGNKKEAEEIVNQTLTHAYSIVDSNAGTGKSGNNANSEVTKLKKALDPDRSREGMPVVSIEYDNGKGISSVAVPVKDHQVNTESIEKSVDLVLSKKARISSAEVGYVARDFDKNLLIKDLQEAQSELSENNTSAAAKNLSEAQKTLIDEDGSKIPHIQKARDNIALARAMVKKEAFDAASGAVREADKSLVSVEEQSADAKQKQKAKEARKELSMISETISRKDPSMLEKTDNQLRKWWDDMSTWTKGALGGKPEGGEGRKEMQQ